MKKIILFLLCSFCLMACTDVYTYDFSVNNEKISMSLTQDVKVKEKENGFSIETDSINVQGVFIESTIFDQYYETVRKDASVKILEQSKNKLIWQVNGDSGTEWNCIIKICKHCSVLMGSLGEANDIYQGIEFKENE